jgi:hypothetical protein
MTMTEQHTPGPWVHAVKRSKVVGLPVVQAGTARSICNVAGFHVDDPVAFMSECLANARLIAAAPELLQCAEKLAALDGGRGGRAFPTEEDCAFARAVIAKAKGTDHA